MSLFLSV